MISLSVNFEAEKELKYIRDRSDFQVSLQVTVTNAYAKTLQDAERPQINNTENNGTFGGHGGGIEDDSIKTSTIGDVPVLTLENAQKLSGLEGVSNVRYLASVQVVGVDIQPVGQKEESAVTDLGTERIVPEFQLEGVSESAMISEFSKDKHELIEGSAIIEDSAEEMVAVIEEGLAKQNHLQLGDTFQVRRADSDITNVYKIIGIYRASEKKSSGVAARVPLLFPENKIYVPVKTISSFEPADNGEHIIDRAIYSLASPADYDSFRLRASDKGIDFHNYRFYQDDTEFTEKAIPIRNLISGSSWTVIATGFTLFVLTVLGTSMIRRYRQHEIQGLLNSGISNQAIFLQFVLEFILLIALGLLLAVIFSSFTFQQFGEFLQFLLAKNREVANVSQVEEVLTILTPAVETNSWLSSLAALSLKNELSVWLSMFVVGFVISVNAAMYPLWKIFHIERESGHDH